MVSVCLRYRAGSCGAGGSRSAALAVSSGSAAASRVGERRVSFTVTYASDATVLAKQNADGSFGKWVPDGIDAAYSPFDYISFGKSDADTVLLEMRKLHRFG